MCTTIQSPGALSVSMCVGHFPWEVDGDLPAATLWIFMEASLMGRRQLCSLYSPIIVELHPHLFYNILSIEWAERPPSIPRHI